MTRPPAPTEQPGADAQHDRETARPAGLARLAHELRTPLAAITALSEVMRDERLGPLVDPRYRAYAADIHQSAQQALAVLSTYLEAGEQLTQSVAMTFAELMPAVESGRSISALRPLAERAGVRLRFEPAERLPRLVADRRSLRQIMDNLLVNAIKFTPPGGTVSLHVHHRVNGPLEFAVEDTGDGISPVALARLLDRCAVPDRVQPRRSGGGIGMPLVRALAVANGGELSITSELGRGTRAMVTFGRDRLLPV